MFFLSIFGFLGCYIWATPSFGSRSNVFLSGKAEIAVTTGHDFAVFFTPPLEQLEMNP